MAYSRSGQGSLKVLLFILLLSCLLFITTDPLRRHDISRLSAVLKKKIAVGRIKVKEKLKEIPVKYKMQPVKWFGFTEENSLKEWEEKVFKGKVAYRIEKAEDLSYVRATSKAAASALYYKIKLDARKKNPVISWRWRMKEFPLKKLPESLETKDEDDFAGRVYVIFSAAFFTNSKVLEYVWAEALPQGSAGTSPYSKNIKLIVAESGKDKDSEWSFEERDIIADYRKAFNRAPEYDIGAIAFMTNTEHTLTSADAMYDDIKVGYKEDAPQGGSKP